MRIAFLVLNALGLLAVIGLIATAYFICAGVATCAASAPRSLSLGGALIPIVLFVISATIATLDMYRRASVWLSLVGLITGAIAAYVSLVAFALALEFVLSDVFEYAVPALLYGSLLFVGCFPVLAMLNVTAIARSLMCNARMSGIDEA